MRHWTREREGDAREPKVELTPDLVSGQRTLGPKDLNYVRQGEMLVVEKEPGSCTYCASGNVPSGSIPVNK